MDAELQAFPWMDQPAIAPVGSVFCGLSPEIALTGICGVGPANGLLDEDAGEQDFADVLAAGQVGNQRLHL